MAYYVEVHAPGAAPERYEISEGSGTIGRGKMDVVSGPPSTDWDAGVATMSVTTGGVTLSVRDGQELTHQGSTLEQAKIAWGEDAYLGSVRLSFIQEGERSGGIHPFVGVIGVFGILFGLGAFIPEAVSSGGAQRPDLPTFEHQAENSSACPATGEVAETQAQRALTLARAKRERYPFSRRDGVEALGLYTQAIACLRQAKKPKDAQFVLQEQTEWRQPLQRDFRDLALNMELKLEAKDVPGALEAVQAMEMMAQEASSGASDEFSTWLSQQKNSLQWRLARK